MATCRASRRKRRRRSSRVQRARTSSSAAPATWRATSRASARTACSSASSATMTPARRHARACAPAARSSSHLVVDPARPTTRKLRFVSEHYSTHLLRADWEMARPVDAEIEARADRRRRSTLLPRAGAVVLSDYAKGVLTPRVIRAVIGRANRLGKPVIVDPKGSDFSIYRGATLDHAEPQGTRRSNAAAGGDRRPRLPPPRASWRARSAARPCW